MTKTARKARSRTFGKIADLTAEVGSGNVFADLGLDAPGERKAKAALAYAINTVIEAHRWTQDEAAERLGTHQPIISALRHGRLKSLSYDRLVNWLVRLGHPVQIRVLPASKDASIEVAIAVGK